MWARSLVVLVSVAAAVDRDEEGWEARDDAARPLIYQDDDTFPEERADRRWGEKPDTSTLSRTHGRASQLVAAEVSAAVARRKSRAGQDAGSIGLPCHSSVIAHSNRNASNPCTDDSNVPGTECEFTCDNGYVPVGRHVCQWHDGAFVHDTSTHVDRNNFSGTWDTNLARYAFWGGRCERLCSGVQSCAAGQSPRRYASSTDDCLVTQCFATGAANLENVARGVYEVMQLGRDSKTGMYYNAINLNWFSRNLVKNGTQEYTAETLSSAKETYQGVMDKNFSVDATAVGILTEVVAVALAFQIPGAAIAKITRTLETLSDSSSEGGFPRDSRGFFAHFYGHYNGDSIRPTKSNPMSTGLLINCALFAKRYFNSLVASERRRSRLLERDRPEVGSDVAALTDLVDGLYNSTDFTQILCDENGNLSPTGQGIPYSISFDGSQCGNWTKYPNEDDLYEFDEEHAAVYLAYQQACGSQPAGACDNEYIELMWNRWQARRLRTEHHYASRPLLTNGAGFLLQLMQYTTSSFNDDVQYQQLFYNHWLSDHLYYKQFMYAGKRGRYGLGEGPLAAWCNEGKRYDQNRLIEKEGTITPGKREGAIVGARDHCSAFSANAVAAYLPADHDLIKAQLLLLLEDGETVVTVPGTEYAVLWRNSILSYEMYGQGRDDINRDFRITLIDLAPELFGLSTLYLSKNFYRQHSKHFDQDGEYNGATRLADLKERRQRRAMERRIAVLQARAERAKAEQTLLKCHSQCGPKGLGGHISESQRECTIDCALRKAVDLHTGRGVAPERSHFAARHQQLFHGTRLQRQPASHDDPRDSPE
jgi:hypothetical protein